MRSPRLVGAMYMALALKVWFMASGCGVAQHMGPGERPPPPEATAAIEVYDPVESRSIAVPIRITSDAGPELRNAMDEIRNKQWQAAREHLQAAIQARPRDHRPHLFLGLIHENRGDWDQAIAAFEASNRIRVTQEAEEGIERCRAKKAMESGE